MKYPRRPLRHQRTPDRPGHDSGFNKHYTLFRQTSREAKTGSSRLTGWACTRPSRSASAFTMTGSMNASSACATSSMPPRSTTLPGSRSSCSISGCCSITSSRNWPRPLHSVTTKILHRNYFHNDFIFVRPSISTENIEGDETQTYRSYYAKDDGLRGAVRKIVEDFQWHRPFDDLARDVDYVYQAVHDFLKGMPRREVNFQIQVLGSAFYRNKAAYIIGKAINGAAEYPFAIRYCKTRTPSSTSTPYCSMLGGSACSSHCRAPISWSTWKCRPATCSSCAPSCPPSRAPSCTSCSALASRVKPCSFRDFIYHLHHSEDKFIMAPASAAWSCWSSRCRPTLTSSS